LLPRLVSLPSMSLQPSATMPPRVAAMPTTAV
jgi:hypothetical protein